MLRKLGAFVLGLIAGNVWNIALSMLNGAVLYPMPEGMDMQDTEQMKAYVATLPALAFVTVLATHLGQAGSGGWPPARLCKSRPRLLSGIVGALTAFGAIHNQIALAGPRWMWIDVPLIIAAAWFDGQA